MGRKGLATVGVVFIVVGVERVVVVVVVVVGSSRQ